VDCFAPESFDRRLPATKPIYPRAFEIEALAPFKFSLTDSVLFRDQFGEAGNDRVLREELKT
jgi:hypothetical protein